MAGQLDGLRVAIIATDYVEQIELEEPRNALEAEGAEVRLIVPEGQSIQGANGLEPADRLSADLTLDDANPAEFDALLIPGGVANPDQLRMDERAVSFVQSFFDANKPVASICHGPWMLVEADRVRGRRVTSYPSLQTDLRNAGAEWVDEEVVNDGNLVTSRRPDDLPAFNQEIINVFGQVRARI